MPGADPDHGSIAVPPDSPPEVVPIGPGQLDRIDDSLHFGWSWHRHRFCYRRADGIKVLDFGCGSGLSTLGLARLNPGATVVGVAGSPEARERAEGRARVDGMPAVDFRAHDLAEPLPNAWGAFDFVVCKGHVGASADPVKLLAHLARALDPRGLLLVTLPTHAQAQAIRQMRQAVDALTGPDAALDERTRIGFDLFAALRPDHLIRRVESGLFGGGEPTPARFQAAFFGDVPRAWTLSEAATLLERAGLQLLYASTRWPWSGERVFVDGAASAALQGRVTALPPDRLALLVDALDPALHAEEYRVYACLAEFDPRLPTWPEERLRDPAAIDRLIPHPTGLVAPDEAATAAVPFSGRSIYRAVNGSRAELDAPADLTLRLSDGRRSCAEIDDAVGARLGVGDTPEARRNRWLELAGRGFVMLEAADPRQHVDCRHLGPIVDRLDCACPRRWIRKCEVHGHCTIAAVGPGDESYAVLRAAEDRLGLSDLIACAECPDYAPEE